MGSLWDCLEYKLFAGSSFLFMNFPENSISNENWQSRKQGLKAFKIVLKYPSQLQVKLSARKIYLSDFNTRKNQ